MNTTLTRFLVDGIFQLFTLFDARQCMLLRIYGYILLLQLRTKDSSQFPPNCSFFFCYERVRFIFDNMVQAKDKVVMTGMTLIICLLIKDITENN